jgi:Trypsin-like peptidase domain
LPGRAMGSLWDDRLAEVWAPPGRAGSGVVLGAFGVLTARHVVAELADGATAGQVLARVIRRGSPPAWVPMRVVDSAPEWDLALLEVDQTRPEEAAAWLRPASPSPAMVAVGGASEKSCEAVGFPDEEVQHPEAAAGPGEWVRQSEQLRGTLSPMGQAKPPVAPRRDLPGEWMPLDADTSTPLDQAGWQGMSGAGVVLADGRLAGIVVDAEAAHQQRRLYMVPLAPALVQSAGLAAAMAAVVGAPVVAEARSAPMYRRLLYSDSLGVDGTPLRLGEITDLGVFGVKPVGLAGEPPYLNYVPRDDDGRLIGALGEAAAANRMLLLVGDSGSGKSRSAAQAVRDTFAAHRLLRPVEHQLPQLPDLPLAYLGPAVVWVDDIEKYAHPALRAILEQLLDTGAVVVGTIRRKELQALTVTGEIRNPSGEAITDGRLVQRLDWKREWSQPERDRTAEHVTNPAALQAVAAGMPLGVWAVAGPQLVNQLAFARSDEDYPCRFALVRAVLDWYRTGLTVPIPRSVAVDLINHAYLDQPADDNDVNDALGWGTHPIDVGGRRGRHSLLMLQEDRLAINDYIQDHDRRHDPPSVPDPLWSAALANASGTNSIWRVGVAAHQAGRADMAQVAWRTLAETANTDAIANLTGRARGQRSVARGGDLFRGRHAALALIRGWLTADQPPGQPLLITGQPGAGKSAVLARAALSVQAEHSGPMLIFPARAATIGDFLTAVADLTGADSPSSTDGLIASLADLPHTPPIRLVMDALDEAASDLDRRQLAEALAELAVLPGLRVAAATRRLALYAPGGVLAALDVTSHVVDLDSDGYFDPDDLRQFAAALLTQEGMDHPGPPGAAWTAYRADRVVCDRLATLIADRAGRNFLFAAVAAVPLSTAPGILDPTVQGFDPAAIPSGVGEALSKYLDQLPAPRRERVRGLLTALAYGRGAGLDDPTWLAFAAALGYPATIADLAALRRSPAADFLHTTTSDRRAPPVTRLFHQALADELLAVRHQPSDERALRDVLWNLSAKSAAPTP